jgi:hypothetical protein
VIACWREGIVADSDLLDAGNLRHWPAPFRGGPLHLFARQGRCGPPGRALESAMAMFTADRDGVNYHDRDKNTGFG